MAENVVGSDEPQSPDTESRERLKNYASRIERLEHLAAAWPPENLSAAMGDL